MSNSPPQPEDHHRIGHLQPFRGSLLRLLIHAFSRDHAVEYCLLYQGFGQVKRKLSPGLVIADGFEEEFSECSQYSERGSPPERRGLERWTKTVWVAWFSSCQIFFHVRNSMRILANGPLTIAFVGASEGSRQSQRLPRCLF